MPTFDARVEILQTLLTEKPDYHHVHDAMRSIGFYQGLLGLHTLPGMYKLVRLDSAENVLASIKRVLQPLGFRFRIQLVEVARELTSNLEPEPSLGLGLASFYGPSYVASKALGKLCTSSATSA